MAQDQTGTSAGKSTQGQSGMQGQGAAQGQMGTQRQTGARAGDGGQTGIDNVTYDLISVAYHALQAAQTYQQYEQYASRGSGQFADFFRKVCDNNKQCAQEALQLLQQCLGGKGMQSGQAAQGGQGEQEDSGMYGRGTR